jgi:hypothetical protein
MKNIISIFIISLILISCKKDSTTYTISGKLMPCGSTNINTQYLDLLQNTNGTTIIADTRTDVGGNFKFTFSATNTLEPLALRISPTGYTTIMENIPVKNISDLNIYFPVYHLIVNLNVTKPYTINDTLSIFLQDNGTPTGLRFVGPFTTGRLITKINMGIYPSIKYGGNTQGIYAGINIRTNPTDYKEYFVPNPTKCTGDTVYVSLDIK